MRSKTPSVHPPKLAKPLHPALHRRAAAVKAAHAHLSQTVPHFRALPGHEQIRQTQAHVRRMLKGGTQ